MKPFAFVAVALLAGCVGSDHDRIADQILAAHESLHDLLFAGTPDASCGGERLAGAGGGLEIFSLPACTTEGDGLETRGLELELELSQPNGTAADDKTLGAYDLVYVSGDELFRGTHLIFTEYAFFTISIDGTDRDATLDGSVTVDGAEVDFAKESFVLP